MSIDPRILEFEKIAFSDDDDLSLQTLDKTLSVNGFIKQLVEKEFKENFLNQKEIFYGIVFRISSLFGVSDLSPEHLFNSTQTGARQFIYKVRVPDVDSAFYSIPDTYDSTVEDRSKIDLYGDFTSDDNIPLALGDIVEVTFGDLKNFKRGRILKKVSSVVDIQIAQKKQPEQKQPEKKQEAFRGKEEKPKKISQTDELNSSTYDEKFANRTYKSVIRLVAEYQNIISISSQKFNIPINLIKGIISVESGFRKDKKNAASGATGMMQIKPDTFNWALTKQKLKKAFIEQFGQATPDITNPSHNIFVGTYYFSYIYERFDNDLQKSAAAYNWGPNQKPLKQLDWKSYLPTETSNYIIRVPSMYKKFNETS